jgi:hypothetical protein
LKSLDLTIIYIWIFMTTPYKYTTNIYMIYNFISWNQTNTIRLCWRRIRISFWI